MAKCMAIFYFLALKGGAVAQSVERATPGQEVLGFDPRCSRTLTTGKVLPQTRGPEC